MLNHSYSAFCHSNTVYVFIFYGCGCHRDLHVLTHSFPTRRSTDLIQEAAFNFLWVAFGGIAVGTGVTWGIARTKTWISRHYGEEGGSQILISLLIPFASYLVAEHLHCSGILDRKSTRLNSSH